MTHTDDIAARDEELRQARMVIKSLRDQLARERAVAEEAKRRSEADSQTAERMAHQLNAIRRSRSWKITRPLRAFRRSNEAVG